MEVLWVIRHKATEGRGSYINGVINYVFGPWAEDHAVNQYSMTDISPRMIQKLFTEKVDTWVPPRPLGARVISKTIAKWMWERASKKGLKPRICTKEEFLKKLRNDAAVGAWNDTLMWESGNKAFADPRFWKIVDEERELHLRGECRLCMYNTMGKREKRPREFGNAKGSRVIWYIVRGPRILNEDGWAKRENTGFGVSGLGVNYLGYVLEDLRDHGSFYWNADVRGFDTSVHSDDLADELLIEEYAEDPRHRALINSIYTLCYRNVLALVPCPSDRNGDGPNWKRRFQRLRQLEADGVITEGDINTEDATRADRVREKVEEALREAGEKLCSQMAVSGDDSVVANNNKEYGRALHYINA
ncbi:hypothetical protein OUZ56_021491 [Daphnia magna]|uniref:RNA-directed RNA polymerase fingers/palm subdomains flavivirus domain-containing protein n=1 Tax=Daphnia magna TaxID=35525 RepID=A0ABQ9ZHI7_9CRUS|nr:hypothetical protein OUZ56_021491 [Daphnia magna]